MIEPPAEGKVDFKGRMLIALLPDSRELVQFLPHLLIPSSGPASSSWDADARDQKKGYPQSPPKFREYSLFARLSLVFAT